jgi:hypothetical protein
MAAKDRNAEGEKLRKEGAAWLDRIKASEKAEKQWMDDADKAVKAYTGELASDAGTSAVLGDTYDFNILFANVETIVPAVINSPPAPDIRRRFADDDPAAKDVAELLERATRIQVDDSKLQVELEAEAQDAFLAGRGVIRVLGFRTSYENLPVKGDPLKEPCDVKGYKLDASGRRLLERQQEHWVTYSPAHSPINTQTIERIRHMIPDPDKMGEDQDGEKLRFMTARWAQIEPAFKAFLSGQEIPVSGTALQAWAGLTQEQADGLRLAGLRTVEEVAELAESHMEKVRLPNMRDLRAQAKLFLENSDVAKAAAREAEKDATISALLERQAAMEAMLEELTKPKAAKASKEAEAA